MYRLALEDVLKLQKELVCHGCGACCRNLPGFFLPGDRKALLDLAEFLNIGLRQLLSDYLVLDFRQPFGQKYWFWTPSVLTKNGRRLVPRYGQEEEFWEEVTDKINCSIKTYPQTASRITAEGGRCIFLDEKSNKCLIQPVKPLSCRLFNCQQKEFNINNWLYFRYFGGDFKKPPEEKKILFAEWGVCWDFHCPCCGQDNVESELGLMLSNSKLSKQKCSSCGYEFVIC